MDSPSDQNVVADNDILSPRNVHLYRLRQGHGLVWISLISGTAGWCAWLALRGSANEFASLIGLMGWFIGLALLVVGVGSVVDVCCHSINCWIKYRVGHWYLLSSLVALPFFSLPYFLQ